jgi:prepilin-type N-terminal cleavage/methylation domain-containing protein
VNSQQTPICAKPIGPACSPSGRRGVTLVELLVVIAVIGGILGLLLPTLQGAIQSARNAAIKTEVDMLHMAIMNYKNEYGNFPPSWDPRNGSAGSGSSVRHLRRLFVRCGNPDAQLNAALGAGTPLTPINSMGFWLLGFTGDPENPLVSPPPGSPPPSGTISRKPLFDFDRPRLQAFRYQSQYASESPILYIDASRYPDVNTMAVTGPDSQRFPVDGSGVARCYVWRDSSSFNPRASPPDFSGDAYHPDSFQIISAGRDGEFFTDDDISNMWSGTWGDWKKRAK